jgi:hypothetical protein
VRNGGLPDIWRSDCEVGPRERMVRSCYHAGMKRKIVGYHTDAENHWVAELECGHGQHVRDDPPWRERRWVRTADGRTSRLGLELNCVRCDEFARIVAEAVIKECRASLVAAYEDAGTSTSAPKF